MDPKRLDGQDDELDIQALLDKYLPDEDREVPKAPEQIPLDSFAAEAATRDEPDFAEETEPSSDEALDVEKIDFTEDAEEFEPGELRDYNTNEIDAVKEDVGDLSFFADVEDAAPEDEASFDEERADDGYDAYNEFSEDVDAAGDDEENGAYGEYTEDAEAPDAEDGYDAYGEYSEEAEAPVAEEGYDAYGEYPVEAETPDVPADDAPEIPDEEPPAVPRLSADEVIKNAADAVLDLGDDELVIDEDIIAELMAADDGQFGGIEGFEDIETLSGFDVTASHKKAAEEKKPESAAEAEPSAAPAPDAVAAEDADEYEDYVGATINELAAENHGETDMDFIVAFGLEDELGRHVGDNKASRLKKSYDKEIERREEIERKTTSNEYRDVSQNAEISELYKKAYRSSKIKIVFTAIMALILMIYENLPLIGYQLSSFLDPAVYPVVYIMVDLQILLLAIAAVYDRALYGFGRLFRGKPSADSILSIASLAAIVYSIIAAAGAKTPVEPTLFNFPVAFCAFMTAIYSYLNIKREIFSFNVISSKRQKYALRRIPASEAVMEAAAFGDEEEDVGDVLKIEKVSFIDGYFYHTESSNSSNGAVVFMCLGLSLVLAVLFGVYSALIDGANSSSLMMGYAALVTALPFSVFFAHSYPFYKANSESYDLNSTIVGENSLDEYSGASIMTFDDKLVFPSVGVKVQNAKVYNNYRFDRVLYYAASVFTKTGGPLSDVFELATLETGYSDDVLLTGIGDGYLQADVDGKTIMFGRAADLIDQGIDIPDDVIAEDPYDGDISVMYMVFKGRLVAKMNIQYALDGDFEYIVGQLAGSGMSVCVKTLDPNIDEEMIKSKVKLDKYPMRVVRYSSLDEISETLDRIDSGVVARGSAKGLLETVTYCEKILDSKRTGSFVCLLQAIVSVVILAVILLSGGFASFRSFFSVLIQLFWMIPMSIVTRAILK